MNDQPRTPTNDPIRNQNNKLRNHRHFKTVVLGLAAAGGAFLAVRSSLKSITSDVHHLAEHVHNIDHNVYNTGTHVIDEIHFQQGFRSRNKRAIQDAKEDKRKFDFYPGLGTLVKKTDEQIAAEKAS